MVESNGDSYDEKYSEIYGLQFWWREIILSHLQESWLRVMGRYGW